MVVQSRDRKVSEGLSTEKAGSNPDRHRITYKSALSVFSMQCTEPYSRNATQKILHFLQRITSFHFYTLYYLTNAQYTICSYN